MDAWDKTTASDLGRGIDSGQIDPVALTEFFLDRIGNHPAADRIFARTTPQRARTEAMAALTRARSGTRRGLLDGVPVSWKDLVDSAGVATEAGSALLAGRVPEHDGAVLAQATSRGAVCLGKTHMTELAFSGLGLNPVTATPPNVHDPALAPGGSSSGAAASVAFGLAPLAIGSDTGGSVRVPSAWNDLVGLKTTAGRITLRGVVDLCARFDTIGPLARSVEDAAQALALLEGGQVADLGGRDLSQMRFAVLNTCAMEGLRDGPAQAFDAALTRVSQAGAEVVQIDVPAVAHAMDLAGIVYPAEAYGRWEQVIEAAPEKMFGEVLKRFRQGAGIPATEYVRAWQALEQSQATYLAAVEEYDAVLIPTSPILPPDAARLLSDPDYFTAENLMALRNTRIGNLLGLCVLTLPTGAPSCGLSLMGRPLEEERLLAVGAAVEAVLPQT